MNTAPLALSSRFSMPTPSTRPIPGIGLPSYPALAPRGYSPQFGGVPAVPNPLATAAETVRGGLELLPDLKRLGRQTNLSLFTQYTGRLPGYSDMAAQSSANIASMLRGEVPSDVRYQLEQAAAQRGVGRGMPSAAITNLDYLRGLGLTSLGLQQEGERALGGAMQRISSVPFFDYTRFLVTPQEQQAAAMHAATLAAAPVPMFASQAQMGALQQGLAAGYGRTSPAAFSWGTPYRTVIGSTASGAPIYGTTY